MALGGMKLPPRFLDLIRRSVSLQKRIKRLDDEIYGTAEAPEEAMTSNPVASQRALLETAFDPRFRK